MKKTHITLPSWHCRNFYSTSYHVNSCITNLQPCQCYLELVQESASHWINLHVVPLPIQIQTHVNVTNVDWHSYLISRWISMLLDVRRPTKRHMIQLWLTWMSWEWTAACGISLSTDCSFWLRRFSKASGMIGLLVLRRRLGSLITVTGYDGGTPVSSFVVVGSSVLSTSVLVEVGCFVWETAAGFWFLRPWSVVRIFFNSSLMDLCSLQSVSRLLIKIWWRCWTWHTPNGC